MTQPTLPIDQAAIATDAPAKPRPGSRAARMAHPTIVAAIRQIAAEHGVCIRPVALRRTDLATGETTVIDLPCGSTRERQCQPCAKRAKTLRMAQCREGWHRVDEPAQEPELNDEQRALLMLRATYEYYRADCLARALWDQVADLDEGIAEVEAEISRAGLRGTAPGVGKSTRDGDAPPRRKRSTRRRQDVPELPRRKVVARTVGRTFAGNGGKVFQPSTFLTVTLGSYGRVREDGSPVNPTTYDYRRAAWDAVHFPALLDRFWQNLRRAEGWNVQYFGCVEPQRRLAPHAHFAIRGTMARAMMRRVAAATYHQVWWPSTATVVYDEGDPQPVWSEEAEQYLDPATGLALSTWGEAMAELDDALDADPDREPEHVIRFGEQIDPKGVLAGTPEAEKLVGYIAKYMTKAVGDCHQATTPAAVEHQRRLWEELRYTPCSPRCPNWLRYGIQPHKARPKQRAGHCRAKVHQLDTLGIGGRRVLVSRDWTGKTLADHRYDQLAWVKQVLRLGLSGDDVDQDQVEAAREGGTPPPVAWEVARPDDPDVPTIGQRLLRLIATRAEHRAALQRAQARDVSATGEAA